MNYWYFIWQDWCLVNCKLGENDDLIIESLTKNTQYFCLLWNKEVHNLSDWCYCNFSELAKEKGRVIFLCNMKSSMQHLNFLCNINAQCSSPNKHFQIFPCLVLYVSSCTCALWHQILCMKEIQKLTLIMKLGILINIYLQQWLEKLQKRVTFG